MHYREVLSGKGPYRWSHCSSYGALCHTLYMLHWSGREVSEVYCYWGVEYLIMQHLKPETYTWQGKRMTSVCGSHKCVTAEGLVSCAKTSFCMIKPCPFLPSGSVTGYSHIAWRLWTTLLTSNSHTQALPSVWVPWELLNWQVICVRYWCESGCHLLITHTLDTNFFYTWIQYKNVSGDYMKVWCIAYARVNWRHNTAFSSECLLSHFLKLLYIMISLFIVD
jgi:hypothetical protein